MGSKTTQFCDICKKEGKVNDKKIQVIFETDQTEGRGTKPYLSDEKLDLCDSCLGHVTDGKGNYIRGYGAMGHNTFYFSDGFGKPRDL